MLYTFGKFLEKTTRRTLETDTASGKVNVELTGARTRKKRVLVSYSVLLYWSAFWHKA